MDLLAAQDVIETIHANFARDTRYGEFSVTGGSISGAEIPDGAYFWVSGSLFNDGLHLAPATDLVDEEFEGDVSVLAIPKTFIKVVEDMEAWAKAHPADRGGYTSESFGGYSYSLPTNSQTGQAATVYDVFRSKLTKWRRLPCL